MIDTGTPLPPLELTDVDGRGARLDDAGETGLPVLLVASAWSDYCAGLEEAFLELCRLNEGDCTVWALFEGTEEDVAEALPRVAAAVRTFAFLPDWEGLGVLGVEKYPTAILCNRGREVVDVVQGWDRTEWTRFLRDTQAKLGWRPGVLPREAPAPGHVVPAALA